MSLGAFLQDDNYGGSWADEVEEVVGSQPLPPATRASGYSSYGGGFERSERSKFSPWSGPGVIATFTSPCAIPPL